MQWFRSYVGTHSDPKFAAIARKTGLHRTMVLSVWLACEEFACASLERGSIAALDLDDVAAALDMDLDDVNAVVVAFKAKAMISEAGRLTAWEKRQFQSDNATARVQRHRAAKRSGNDDETLHDADVTPPDTDTDTEAESKKGARAPRFEIPDWCPLEAWQAFEEMRKKARKPMTDRAKQMIINELGDLRKSGCDPGAVLLQSVKHCWQGVFPIKDGHNGSSDRRHPGEQPSKTDRAKAAIMRAAIAGGYAPVESEGEAGGGDDPLPVLPVLAPLRERA